MNIDDRSHLIIPIESIKKQEYEKSGFGEVFNRQNIPEHSQKLKRNFSAITSRLQQSKDFEYIDTLTVSIVTPKEWDAKKEKGHLNDLGFTILDYSRKYPNIVTVSIPKNKWPEVEKKISLYAEKGGVGKTNLQAINGFIPRLASDSLNITTDESDKLIDVNITFFSILTKKEVINISEHLITELKKNNRSVKVIQLSDDDVIVSCSASINELKGIVKDYISVKSIVNDDIVFIEKASIRTNSHKTVLVSRPLTNQIIAVIDDGISPREDLAPLVTERLSPQVANAVTVPAIHGTYVASRCVFGDLDLDSLGSEVEPCCWLDDIPVFGIDSSGNKLSPRESDLINAIDAFVSKNYKTVKIYNLSLGFGAPLIYQKFSETAKRLDLLSKKYDVLFVIASGNNNSLLGLFPEDHFKNPYASISSPSESLTCLSVGSIAKKESAISMSKYNEISPFSKIGPGLFGSIKPDLVAHGGNLVNGYKPDADISTCGFSVANGLIENDIGTSFSAPIVSNIAAQLFDYYPMYGSNMIRALLIHGAEERIFPQKLNIESHLGCGYGEPDLQKCLQSDNFSCVFLTEGELDTSNYDLVPFYIPKILADGKQSLRIKITITFNPEVNKNNDEEYSCSRISSNLQRLKDNCLTKKNPEEINLSAPYSTVIRYSCSMKRNIEPGEWAVKLRLYSRNVDQAIYKQKYALVIEIRDELSKIDLREQVINETGEMYIKKLKERKMA